MCTMEATGEESTNKKIDGEREREIYVVVLACVMG